MKESGLGARSRFASHFKTEYDRSTAHIVSGHAAMATFFQITL
jgi:hypothetical protein